MKVTKRQLKQLLRRTLRESGDIYPRPQHPMIANAGTNTRADRLACIADTLAEYMDLQDEPELVDEVAEAILASLKEQGLI